METSEIQELLEKMNVLEKQEQGLSINPQALMVDPIVSNKLAVELLQKVDREAKPEIVLSLSGVDSYFAYNIALSAWMKFGVCDFESGEITSSLSLKKKDKVIVVLDTFNEEIAQKMISFVESKEARVMAVLSLVGANSTIQNIPCHSLL